MNIKNFYKNKYFWIRFSAILVLILLAVLLLLIGKQHQFIIDANAYENNGETFNAPSITSVKIDKRPALEIPRRTRLEIFSTGENHKIVVEYNGKTIKKKFSVPFSMNQVLISIPALIAGKDESEWLKPFISNTQLQVEEEKTEDNSEVLPEMTF